jgi:hypothetical protein
MPKALFFLAACLVFPFSRACCVELAATADFSYSLDGYLRSDLVSFKNPVDLDSHGKDDQTCYLGFDYGIGLKGVSQSAGPEFLIRLERNGPYDYNAPLFVQNTLMTSDGAIERYSQEELLPQLEEFWLDLPLPSGVRWKTGLYSYEVGNGFSLNGGYENYGLSIYRPDGDLAWGLYYCRPDMVYKNRLGPRIRQEEEQGIDYEHNAANFFACDVKMDKGDSSFQPYLGVLSDHTSAGKRDSVFATPVKKDILGTLGFAWSLKKKVFGLELEAARNFGKAVSDEDGYKDVTHQGYLIYAGADYYAGDKLTTYLQFLLCSGNKVTPDMAWDEAYASGKNRAFSYFSPLNRNLGDSVSASNSGMRPLVASGAGYGLQYGISRPSTFYASDFDNLIMPCWGFEWSITDRLSLNPEVYYLFSFTRGVGVLNGEARYLSRDLGCEVDSYLDYKVTKNLTFSLGAGCFFPGKYYEEERDDTEGSLFSPYVRGDGDADAAYQIELTVELRF